MGENNKKSNILVKRKLISKFNKFGINRLNSEAINLVEIYTQRYLDKLMEILKQEMITHARKTLKKEDVKKAIKKLDSKYTNDFEI